MLWLRLRRATCGTSRRRRKSVYDYVACRATCRGGVAAIRDTRFCVYDKKRRRVSRDSPRDVACRKTVYDYVARRRGSRGDAAKWKRKIHSFLRRAPRHGLFAGKPPKGLALHKEGKKILFKFFRFSDSP
jgi:hypothetical protein